MSLDYSIFLYSENKVSESVLRPVMSVAGVQFSNGVCFIDGLANVTCEQLSEEHREIMLEEYGKYGIDVNWEIKGTYDKAIDIFLVVEILFRCAALLVNTNPDKNLTLMRNAESFYVFNTPDRLILSPVYIKSVPVIMTLFEKPFAIEEMLY